MKMQSEESVTRTSEFWGICCEGGKKYSQVVRQKFHITMAALDPTVVPTSPVVSLMVDRGGCEYLLCSLKPGSVLQVNLNLYFDKGEKVTFSLRGQGKIHLSGYHIFNKNVQEEKSPIQKGRISPVKPASKKVGISKSNAKESSDSVDSEEENKSKKAQNISLKKKPEDMAKSTKGNNAKISVVNIVDSGSSSEEDHAPKKDLKTGLKKGTEEKKGKLSFSPKKKVEIAPSKKTGQNAKKVKEDSDDESDDDILNDLDDDDDDSDEEDSDKEMNADKDTKKLESYKRLWSSLTQSDEEDDESDSEDDEEDDDDEEMVSSKKNTHEKKKLKSDTSTPLTNKKLAKSTPLKSATGSPLNSSIGRTPMPQKKTPKTNQVSENLSPKKVTFTESSDSDIDQQLKQKNEPPTPSSEKKKKKKKKKALNTSNDLNASTDKATKTSLSASTYSKKLPGGLEYEDIRIGNGPLAKNGRVVHVYYTGMLENNKVFDSRPVGTKPFSFKLGSGNVIKGWDLGIDGMKVGGKRRMKIPASLGYKNQKMGPIPANSTLYFNVELKSVT